MFSGLNNTKLCFGNEYHFLHLKHLIDNPNNKLVIVISLTKKIKTTLDSIKHIENENIREALLETTELIPDESQTYEIYFDNYLFYQGRNESYTQANDDDIRIGKGLILFEKSQLLNYADKFISVDLASIIHKKTELRHYGVYTLNNIIDVVTFYEPVIRKSKYT